MIACRTNLVGCLLTLWSAASLSAASLLGPVVDAFVRNHPRGGEIACVLSETGGREVIYSQWPEFARPIPLGSLVKPFTALAYGESHGGQFPQMDCTPESGCWLPSGHGRIDVEQAIAQSCNAYFRGLSEQLSHADLARITARFGLAAPARPAHTDAFFGLGAEWKLAPVAMVRAYEELPRRGNEPLVARVLAGLRGSAAGGTARGVTRGVNRSAFGKTGTAPCVHGSDADHPSNGDGYALVMFPAEQPRYTLFVQVHGVPGRIAADVAGEILRLVTAGGGS